MHDDVQRTGDRIDAGYRGDDTAGISVRDLLLGFSAAEAAAHPIAGAHSAREIARHLAFWHDAVRRRLEGESVPFQSDKDWPPMGESTEESWKAEIDALDETHSALVKRVRALDPEALSRVIPGRSVTIHFMLQGVSEHDLYHGGQIMMLRTALRASPPRSAA